MKLRSDSQSNGNVADDGDSALIEEAHRRFGLDNSASGHMKCNYHVPPTSKKAAREGDAAKTYIPSVFCGRLKSDGRVLLRCFIKPSEAVWDLVSEEYAQAYIVDKENRRARTWHHDTHRDKKRKPPVRFILEPRNDDDDDDDDD